MHLLKDIAIHPDWNDFLSQKIRKEIEIIEKEIIVAEFTPEAVKVLRFLTLPLSQIKVIIIGQDPYPQKGVATGRAFEVGTLQSWSEPFSNISLKNILRAVYKAYTGEVITYRELKAKLDNEFPLAPPGKIFEYWEQQGVMFLNTSFTCQSGKPGSHRGIWQEFSAELFRYIHFSMPDIFWFLWGNHAREAVYGLELRHALASMHPMMCFDQPGRENDFLYGEMNCFEKTGHIINWAGFKKGSMIRSGSLF